MALRKHYRTGDRVQSICFGFYLNAKGTITGRPQFSYGTPEYMVQLDGIKYPKKFKWNWLRPLDPEEERNGNNGTDYDN